MVGGDKLLSTCFGIYLERVPVEDFKLAHKMIARREVTKRKPNGKWRKSYIRCGICGKGLCKYGNKSSYRCKKIWLFAREIRNHSYEYLSQHK